VLFHAHAYHCLTGPPLKTTLGYVVDLPATSIVHSVLPLSLHCDKSLFVLVSRQKIPVLRTENPAVDTRTIFKINDARKATAGKSRPETTDTAGKSRPSGLWRETFFIPLPEKVRPENPGK
jgi:hypothetical protein